MFARMLAVTLVSAAPLTQSLFAQTPALVAPGTDRVAAYVNSEKIMESQVKQILDQRPLVTPVPESEAKAIRKAALDMLIEDLLMRQFLRVNAPRINDAEIDKVLDTMRATLQKDNKTLEEFLRLEKQTMDELRSDIATKLRWREYLVTRINEVEAHSYYQQNKPYFDMQRVRASHVLAAVPAGADFNAKQAAQNRINQLKARVEQGEPFDKVARENSDCPSKEKGGDIGYFRYKFMVVDSVARAAFSMRKDEIRVVESPFGWHLLKVTDIDVGQPSSFAAVKDMVRETIAQERRIYQEVLEAQRKSAQIRIELDR
jgi:parvulin-like peptidyl-prolyl isomerase